MTELEKLKAENKVLKAQIDTLKSNNSTLKKLTEFYKEQLKANRKEKFGASSEQMSYDCEQLSLFNEVEAVVSENPIIEEPTEETITNKNKKNSKSKKSKNKKSSFAGLPVEKIEYKLEDLSCKKCEGTYHILKTIVRKEVQIIPATAKIVEHITYVYACRNCENTDIESNIVKSNSIKALIPKSFVSPSLMAYIMYQKYVKAIPLDRQSKDFKMFDLILSKQILSKWMIKGAELLKPFHDSLKIDLLKRDVIHSDDTSLEVLNEPGKAPSSKSYMWVYRTSGDTDKHISIFEYTPGRSKNYIKEFLEGYKGILTTDGYAAYHVVEPEITLTGCMAHARRKFFEANELEPKDTVNSVSLKALNYIAKLFKIEEEIRDLSYDEKYNIRQEKSKYIIEEFYKFVDDKIVVTLPKSKLGGAFGYAQNQKKYLIEFLNDGRIELSNNRAERTIKPFVIGRKNWLFCNTVNGAKSSAIIYSIVETAKENGLNPYKYLKFLFEQIQLQNEDLESLKPWSSNIPEDLKIINNEKNN